MQDSIQNHPVKDDSNISSASDKKAARTSDRRNSRVETAECDIEDTSDPFNVDDRNWSFEKTLLAAIEGAKQAGDGPIIPRISLSFKNVEAYGDDAGIVAQADAGSLFTDVFQFSFRSRRKRPEKEIIRGIDGLLHEGEMLLVLGGPGSGCTTFLKMLSGHREGYRRWGGQVRYSGIPLDEMLPRSRGLIIYSGEVDDHFSHLTVAQTLAFAISTKTPHRRINGMSRKEYIQWARDILGAIFGLTHNFHTKIGNDFVRGLSGGEKRRLAIAETVGSFHVRFCWLYVDYHHS
jgi:energy-coupling factor transporter ATP-binding protein EcfA2